MNGFVLGIRRKTNNIKFFKRQIEEIFMKGIISVSGDKFLLKALSEKLIENGFSKQFSTGDNYLIINQLTGYIYFTKEKVKVKSSKVDQYICGLPDAWDELKDISFSKSDKRKKSIEDALKSNTYNSGKIQGYSDIIKYLEDSINRINRLIQREDEQNNYEKTIEYAIEHNALMGVMRTIKNDFITNNKN